MVPGTPTCGTQCYTFFIDPFCQGFYNIRDALDTKATRVAQDALSGASPQPAIPFSLADRVCKAAVGFLLIIPIVNLVVAAILRGIQSKFLYAQNPQPISSLSPPPRNVPPPPRNVPPPPRNVPPPPPPAPRPSSEELSARKRAAVTRLDEIEATIPGNADPLASLKASFRCAPEVLSFNLDALLQRYQTTEPVTQLLDFIEWADLPIEEHYRFRDNIFTYHHPRNDQEIVISNLLKNLVAYFDQERDRIEPGTPEEDALKQKFRHVAHSIAAIEAWRINEFLTQMQTIALNVLADSAASEGETSSEKIRSQAGLALCRYRTKLLHSILVRQNPNYDDMPSFEREVTKIVAEDLGLGGAIFEVGARFPEYNINARARNAMITFRREYKPEQYLLEQLKTDHDTTQSLRNEMLAWINEHYYLTDANENAESAVMDRKLSESQESFETRSASQGGNFNHIAVAFLMEKLGAFLEIPPPPPPPPPPSPEELTARKTEAMNRFDQIENLIPGGINPLEALTNHFRCTPEILAFDLDAFLARYQTTERVTKLFDFLEWAEIPVEQHWRFTTQVSSYDTDTPRNNQAAAITGLLKNLVAYFDQEQDRIEQGTPEDDVLKQKFRDVFDGITAPGCVDQLLSQMQAIALNVLADGATSEGTTSPEKIRAQAGLALCRYRAELLRDILIRQNNHTTRHMADLEREVTQIVAAELGLRGAIFTAGAGITGLLGNVNGRAQNVVTAFRQEYKPEQYLLDQLRTFHGLTQSLRNEILIWTNEHYYLADADDNVESAAMDRKLSESQETFEEMSAAQGGNFNHVGVALLMEKLGLIHQAP